jgi:hypothetical protein
MVTRLRRSSRNCPTGGNLKPATVENDPASRGSYQERSDFSVWHAANSGGYPLGGKFGRENHRKSEEFPQKQLAEKFPKGKRFSVVA